MAYHTRTWTALVVCLGALWAGAEPARGAPVAKPSSALVLAPEDAAFFSTSLRNREQVERLLKSKAFAKLRDLPAIQTAWQLFLNEYNNPFGEMAEFRAFVEAEENRELIALLLDAGSQEVFLYGGKGWGDFLKLYLEVNQAQTFGPLQAGLAGGNPGPAQGRAILEVLLKNKDRLRVPDLVIGFRLTDTKKAQSQIKRLEEMLKLVMNDAPPPIRDALKRVKIGDDSFLTLQLNGSMVPWEQVPFGEVETKPGEFDPLVEKLRAMTLTVALGVRGDYLLLSVGASHSHLGTLGKGKVLADRPEFKPLSKAEGKPLTGIGYASKEFMAQVSEYNVQQLTSMAAVARAGLAASDLPAEKQKAISDDLDAFVAELRKGIPEAGAAMSFSFMTDRGYESYSYNHSAHPSVDSSQPLTLLDHVGGDPILATVGRSKGDLEGYEFLAKWVKKAYGHADELLRAHLSPEEKEQYEKAAKVFVPLAEKFDEVTRTLFLPAFDGQFGLVIDGKWKSKQWHKDLALPAEMPLPEFGLVFGVKDAEKLKKAGAEYRELFNTAMAEVRKLAPPDEVPVIEIPAPTAEEKKGGTVYTYPIPKEAGLDEQVAPNAGLSESVAVMTLSKGHSVRLLTPTPLKVDSKPLADRKRNATAATVFNFPALVDAAEPWIRLGVQVAEAEIQRNAGEDLPAGFRNLGNQADTVLKVLRCLRGFTSVTYVEDGALVTHSESVYKDLDE